MKKLIALGLPLCLLCFSPSTFAVMAILQSCTFGQSVTFQPIYIDVYRVTTTGQVFERYFPASGGWCPQTVEVY